jgi:RNA polymerase sigma-70 factor (ECF subfamily)
MKMTDRELIDNYLAGDLRAFNLLVWRWQKPLFHFAYRYSASAETAKEVAQVTCIRVYKNIHRLKDRDKFVPWLYRIALNVCRDYCRGGRRTFISIDDLGGGEKAMPDELRAGDGDDPGREAQRRETAGLIANAVQALPEEQRVVVIMKQYQGLKFHEIAEILQAPVNTIKTRMYAGLAALRLTLTAWDVTG